MTDDPALPGEDDLVAAVDGRLDATRAAAVEARLAADPDLAARVAAERRDREALRAALAPIADEPVPARLRIATILAERRRRHRRLSSMAAAAALIFALGLGSGALATLALGGAPATLALGGAPATVALGGAPTPARPVFATVADEATAAHRLFVVEVVHPVEVDAGHEAHLLGWLGKRLGRPIAAPDLGRFGYRLIGGRLLPAGGTAAAQLMYEDAGGARLTVWVQAAAGETTAFRYGREGDVSTFVWLDRGWGFAVTAGLDRERLLPIAEAVWTRLDGTGEALRPG